MSTAHEPLQVPEADRRAAVLRALLEGTAGLIPVGGLLARLYQTTHPPQFERALQAWRVALSDQVNDHARRLAELEARFEPELLLSALAIEIAFWIVSQAGDERPEVHTLTDLLAAAPHAPADRVEEALHELAEFELIRFPLILGGAQGPGARPRFELFWLFEPLVSAVSPLADAECIARLALTEDQVLAPEILTRFGWTSRRVATALAVLEPLIPEAHKGRPANPSFPLFSLHVDAGSRMRLRRYLGDA